MKVLQKIILSALAVVLAIPFTSFAAETGDSVRDAHRLAAQKYIDAMHAGTKLSGSVDENGTKGRFEAYFLSGTAVVKQSFGSIDSQSYSGPRGFWSGSSTSLPFQVEAQDSPAQTALNMLGDGSYLKDPNWERFRFVSEEAGGFAFTFEPDGLPPVRIVLYSDPSEPWYLQMMSAELQFSPSDPSTSTYRAYYYYKTTASGQLYTTRETGKELDGNGDTVSFSDYSVDAAEPIKELPEAAQFNFERVPPGGAGSLMTAPADIPVDCSKGYFLFPLTFAGSDKTWLFLLDTGASASLFSPAAADAAGLSLDLKVPAHGHGTRVDFEIGLCRTASAGRADADPASRPALAPFTVARIAQENRDVLSALESYGADGILGVGLLMQYVCRFDHDASKITLIPMHLFDPAVHVGRPNIEFVLDSEDLFFITGAVSDGQGHDFKGEICVDTGLQMSLALLRETIDHAMLNFEKVSESTNTVLGGMKRFDYVKVPQFDLGPMTNRDVVASVTEDDNGSLSGRKLLGFVGVPLFFNALITVDLFRQRMYVEPSDPTKLEELFKQTPTVGEEAPPEDKQPETELPVNIGSSTSGAARG